MRIYSFDKQFRLFLPFSFMLLKIAVSWTSTGRNKNGTISNAEATTRASFRGYAPFIQLASDLMHWIVHFFCGMLTIIDRMVVCSTAHSHASTVANCDISAKTMVVSMNFIVNGSIRVAANECLPQSYHSVEILRRIINDAGRPTHKSNAKIKV